MESAGAEPPEGGSSNPPAPTPTQTNFVGFPGNAFGGMNYISTTATLPGGTTIGEMTPITVSAYVQTFDYNAGNYVVLVAKNANTSTQAFGHWFGFDNSNDGSWYAQIGTGGTPVICPADSGVSHPKIPLRAWTHLGWTYDGTTLSTYMNGALISSTVASPSGPITFAGHGSWDVGGGFNVANVCLNGPMSDVRVASVVRDVTWFKTMSVVDVLVAPPTGSVLVDSTIALDASAIDLDGRIEDVTAYATWTTSDATRATVVAGVVTGVVAGTATITATLGAFSASATITVGGSLQSIAIVPPTIPTTLDVGDSLQLTAVGHYSDGSNVDITRQVTWTSSDSSKLTVVGGLVTSVAASRTPVTITATL